MKLDTAIAAITIAIILGLTPVEAQRETPTTNPSVVTVKGRVVSHSWRNGRIWVPTSDLQPLLNVTSDYPSMDLLKTLEEKGGYIWQVVDGRFEAKLDPTRYSQPANAGPGGIQNSGGTDYRLAERRMAEAFGKYPRVDSHPDLPRVQRIGQKIVAVSDMPTLNWNFFVVHDAEPNAFCCGAGWVAVTDGLLALKLSDDELAGVLAHEIGHGCRKDVEDDKFNREQMDRYENEAVRLEQERQALLSRKQELLTKAQHYLNLAETAYTNSAAEDYLNQARRLVDQAKQLDKPIGKLEKQIDDKIHQYKGKEALVTESVYQHKNEYDADIKGIYYATRAGYSPTGLMESLKKLAHSNSGRFGQAAYQGGFSHPPVASRIKTMNKVLSDWRSQR